MRLHLDRISVHLGAARIVHDLTVDCPPGTFVGLLGPNGSGKSTALRTIYRAIAPTAGAVRLDEADLYRDLTARQSARRVAALAQETTDGFDFTVDEIVCAGRTPHKNAWSPLTAADRAIIDRTLRTVGMDGHVGRAFATLSGGEKQRVLLARALAQEPSVLVLDEPTNHLDIATQLHLLDLVRSLGITVLAALHDLNLAAAYCDRLYVLRDGTVVASGTPDEVLTPELVTKVFGVHAHRGTHPVTGRPHLAFASLPMSVPVRGMS